MTRERTIIPTTLLDWPRVEPLMTEYKFIYCFFWFGRYTNCIGVAQHIPYTAVATSLKIQRSLLEEGIKILDKEELILWDQAANEIWIRDWFRFHTFKDKGISIAIRNCQAVQSERIRKALIVAAPWLAIQEISTLKTAINDLPTQQQLQQKHQQEPQPQEPQPPKASGGGISVHDSHLDAVFNDCPFQWRDALSFELDAAFKAKRIRTTPARWARGTLDKWLATGEPDSLAIKHLLEENARTFANKKSAELEIAARKLIGQTEPAPVFLDTNLELNRV